MRSYERVLSPTTDMMRVVMKNSLQNVAGSLNTTMPSITVPTAPIPVHTGYAVPIGIVCVTFANRVILSIVKMRKPLIQYHQNRPSAVLALPRQYVNPTSHSPAIINRIQFIRKILQPVEGCKIFLGDSF